MRFYPGCSVSDDHRAEKPRVNAYLDTVRMDRHTGDHRAHDVPDALRGLLVPATRKRRSRQLPLPMLDGVDGNRRESVDLVIPL